MRERGIRKFKSIRQARRFVTAHAAVSNLFNLGRHLVRAQHYRDLRISADARRPYPLSWEEQHPLFKALPDQLSRMCLFKVNTGPSPVKWVEPKTPALVVLRHRTQGFGAW